MPHRTDPPPRPRLLAFETGAALPPPVAAAGRGGAIGAGGSGGVALLAPPLVRERGFAPGETAGKDLLALAAALLAEAGLAAREIDALAVAVGPGSYTGLRIGVAAAKTLAWAAGLKLVAVASLEALACAAAARFPDEAAARRLVPAVDAKQGLVYARFFEPSGAAAPAAAATLARPRALSADLVLTPEEFWRSPLAAAEGGLLVVGSGAPLLEAAAPPGVPALFRAAPAGPTPATVGRLGLVLLAAGEVVSDVHALAPVYLRPAEAELRRRERLAAARNEAARD